MRTTSAAAHAVLLFALLAAATPAAAGYTLYSIDEAELAKHQSYGIEFAHFAPANSGGALNDFDLQFWIGDEGGQSDVPGGGVGLSFNRFLDDRFSAGVNAGTMASTMGSWWIGAQAALNLEGPGGLLLRPQLAASVQDAQEDFGLQCRGLLGTYRHLPVSALHYTHLYAHVQLSARAFGLRWILDLGSLTTYSHLTSNEEHPDGSPNECVREPVDSVTQFLGGAGVAAEMGSIRLFAGVRSGSVSLQLGVSR